MIPCLQVDGTADGGRTAPPPMLVSLDVTAKDSGWIVGLASTRSSGGWPIYRSSLNPGSTRTLSTAFPTAHPVAYIHWATRVSLP